MLKSLLGRESKVGELDELRQLITEATWEIEQLFDIDETDWVQVGSYNTQGLTEIQRKEIVRNSRKYYYKDPLAKQAIRMWTTYSFGGRVSVQSKDEDVQKLIDTFMEDPENKSVLSATGIAKSSDKGLVDGELFFVLFYGKGSGMKIRRLMEPMEITEFITNPEDVEDIRYFKRVWGDTMLRMHEDYYASTMNLTGEPTPYLYAPTSNILEGPTAEGYIYHLPFNTIYQRGYPLLTPVLDWLKEYRRYLASRIAIMLALARFAWKQKMKGGASAIAAQKAKTDDKWPQAASTLIENLGVDTTPVKTDTGAKNAYTDGRMVKLQVAAGVGIPEQYFGDVSVGNFATSKTVELPMLKQFEQYQNVWADALQDILNVLFEFEGVSEEKRKLDIDFPPIAPKDAAEAAKAMAALIGAFPEFAGSPEVKQVALQNMGVNNVTDVLDTLAEEMNKNGDVKEATLVKLISALREAKTAFGAPDEPECSEHDHTNGL